MSWLTSKVLQDVVGQRLAGGQAVLVGELEVDAAVDAAAAGLLGRLRRSWRTTRVTPGSVTRVVREADVAAEEGVEDRGRGAR